MQSSSDNSKEPSINAQIASRIQQVRQRIADAEQRYQRQPGSVRLLAVSKTHPLELVRQAAECGLQCFGESYWQDAQSKVLALPELEWHFIGPLQSNKCKPVAQHFAWLHSLEREKIARALDSHRPDGSAPLQVCLQVNLSGEASKSGVAAKDCAALAESVATLPNLQLRGLMSIPPRSANESESRRLFAQLRALLQQLSRDHPGLDTLSMGMSRDLEWAIAEGATIVRVGSDIFGPRQ